MDFLSYKTHIKPNHELYSDSQPHRDLHTCLDFDFILSLKLIRSSRTQVTSNIAYIFHGPNFIKLVPP